MEATELNLSNVPYLIGGWWAHVPTSQINMEFQQQPSSYSSSDLSLAERKGLRKIPYLVHQLWQKSVYFKLI